MGAYKVGIADDHRLLRFGLRMLLENQADLRISMEAESGFETIDKLRRAPVDLLILDITMPGLDGFAVLEKIRQIRPETKVLILTMHNTRDTLVRALNLGANGFYLKEDPEEGIIEAIRQIRAGKLFFPSRVRDQTPSIRLTPKEIDVLRCLAQGKTAAETARTLSESTGSKVEPATVKKHRQHINEKFGTNKREEIVRKAQEIGLL